MQFDNKAPYLQLDPLNVRECFNFTMSFQAHRILARSQIRKETVPLDTPENNTIQSNNFILPYIQYFTEILYGLTEKKN